MQFSLKVRRERISSKIRMKRVYGVFQNFLICILGLVECLRWLKPVITNFKTSMFKYSIMKKKRATIIHNRKKILIDFVEGEEWKKKNSFEMKWNLRELDSSPLWTLFKSWWERISKVILHWCTTLIIC